MSDTTYDMVHVPTVQRFMQSEKFIQYIQGPFGSGKSTGCVQKILQLAAAQTPQKIGNKWVRKTRFAVVRNTYPQLRDSTIKTWLDWFPDGTWGKYKVAEHEYYMEFLDGEGTRVKSEILFRALDRPEHVSNLLSTEYTGAWFNEARDVNKEVFEAMQGRVGRYPARKDGGCRWDGIMMDSNPPDTDHWIYKLFEEIRPDNAEAFYQPSGLSHEAENIPNLKQGYYETISKGKDADWVRVYVDGQYGFVKAGKPVYPQYNDSIHCKPFDVDPALPIYRGWDFGNTPACVIAQLAPNGQLRIIDEVTSDRAGIKEFAKAVEDHCKREYPMIPILGDFGDPAGQSVTQVTVSESVFSIMWDMGIRIEEGQQDLDVRLSSVKERLTTMVEGHPGLIVRPQAQKIRKGFMGAYAYKRLQVSTESYTDKPDKGHYSHIHDALQYLCTRLYGSYGMVDVEPPKVIGSSARGY